MCGIVGYLGEDDCVPILIEGLRRLEHRGYDSAGLAVHATRSNGSEQERTIEVRKNEGRIGDLERMLRDQPLDGRLGIGHTRWATHGAPSTINAHPHTDEMGRIAVVHNGIIENCEALKALLEREGHRFRSETDTEVFAHLIEKYYDGDLEMAVRRALHHVEGAYAICALAADEPDVLVAARLGGSLVVGSGDGGTFVASDVCAILAHTNRVIYVNEGEMVTVRGGDFRISTFEDEDVDPEVQEVTWSLEAIEKGGFETFMQKEMFEQPSSLRNTLRGRLELESGSAHLQGLADHQDALARARRLILTACGTSWHAALIGEYMLEEYARIPVEVEYASEFRYRNPIIEPDTVVFVISQSGETADTLAALREAKRRGALTLGICNVVGSAIARETDGGVYLHAGPEIGVASTKAFTSQVATLAMLTLFMGRMRHLSPEEGHRLVRALEAVPNQIEALLALDGEVAAIAQEFKGAENYLYLARSINFPVALEGALKIKELAYVHAEGNTAGEMKHGPLALIDENMPVVFIAVRDSVYEKVLSNIHEVKARGGRVIAIATEGDNGLSKLCDHVIPIPQTLDPLIPLLSVIPFQLLAYHMARLRGLDVDKPRNLAKSVTVE
jgi:glucosamine--fructose-6-phosphate aminotransferase (isomerizing)